MSDDAPSIKIATTNDPTVTSFCAQVKTSAKEVSDSCEKFKAVLAANPNDVPLSATEMVKNSAVSTKKLIDLLNKSDFQTPTTHKLKQNVVICARIAKNNLEDMIKSLPELVSKPSDKDQRKKLTKNASTVIDASHKILSLISVFLESDTQIDTALITSCITEIKALSGVVLSDLPDQDKYVSAAKTACSSLGKLKHAVKSASLSEFDPLKDAIVLFVTESKALFQSTNKSAELKAKFEGIRDKLLEMIFSIESKQSGGLSSRRSKTSKIRNRVSFSGGGGGEPGGGGDDDTVDGAAKELIDLFQNEFQAFQGEWKATSKTNQALFQLKIKNVLNVLMGENNRKLNVRISKRISTGFADGLAGGFKATSRPKSMSAIRALQMTQGVGLGNDTVEDVVSHIMEVFVNVSVNLGQGIPDTEQRALLKVSLSFLESVKKAYSMIAGDPSVRAMHPDVQAIVESVKGTIEACIDDLDAQPDKLILSDTKPDENKLIASNLRESVYDLSNGLRSLGICALSSSNSRQKPMPEILFMCASTSCLCSQVTSLVSTIATLNHLLAGSIPKSPNTRAAEDSATPSLNIWKETDYKNKKGGFLWAEKEKSKKKSPEKGSLNKLVINMTSDVNLDQTFLKTFITTYRSFTTPHQLFLKLLERFNVPPNTLPEQRIKNVQMRVAIVLKHWLENQFNDFDEELLTKFKTFLTTTMSSAGMQDMAAKLITLLDKRTEERALRVQAIVNVPSDMSAIESLQDPCEFFMNMSDEEIARQLTTIDYEILLNIEPAELLNQAWAKKPFRAPHVTKLIGRLNKISMWVAWMILMQERVADRCTLVTKWIHIASHLRRMNNFHTLMGVVTGLSQAAVSRLKHTFAMVDKKVMQEFHSLEQLMSPQGSYKVYRKALVQGQAKSTLPFLGVYLSDLTFIEDGNPDMIVRTSKEDKTEVELINFKKREMVYNVIQQILMFQDNKYKFPPVEPISTLLTETPYMSDAKSFDLSLFREPRNADPKSII